MATSLRFLCEVLPWLPPHQISLREDSTPPCLVWSDGACEGRGECQDIGFLALNPKAGTAFPSDTEKSGLPERLAYLRRNFTAMHGAAAIPQELRDIFLSRRQYIGQDEIVGAICPYLSVPELAGKKVIHWIDNTSALAALTKGFSRMCDSASLVHAFHAWNTGARADVWFDWVPSKSNPADEPSRDLSLADRLWECAPGIVSQPVEVVFPSIRELDDPQR